MNAMMPRRHFQLNRTFKSIKTLIRFHQTMLLSIQMHSEIKKKMGKYSENHQKKT